MQNSSLAIIESKSFKYVFTFIVILAVVRVLDSVQENEWKIS